MPLDTPYDALSKCGAKHPRYPGLTCRCIGGPCDLDWHIGELEHRDRYGLVTHVEIVQWGTAAEDFARTFQEKRWPIIRLEL